MDNKASKGRSKKDKYTPNIHARHHHSLVDAFSSMASNAEPLMLNPHPPPSTGRSIPFTYEALSTSKDYEQTIYLREDHRRPKKTEQASLVGAQPERRVGNLLGVTHTLQRGEHLGKVFEPCRCSNARGNIAGGDSIDSDSARAVRVGKGPGEAEDAAL